MKIYPIYSQQKKHGPSTEGLRGGGLDHRTFSTNMFILLLKGSLTARLEMLSHLKINIPFLKLFNKTLFEQLHNS